MIEEDIVPFWNAIRFIVLCPYKAHEKHDAYKDPGGNEKTRTVRIDCPSYVPMDQLMTAAHFTWPHVVFRAGETPQDFQSDPEDREKHWEVENYRDLYVFARIDKDGQVAIPSREVSPDLDALNKRQWEKYSRQKEQGYRGSFYFSTIFHITRTGDLRPIRHGDGMPGIELTRMRHTKKRRYLISAAFIKNWLDDHELNNSR